MPTTRSGRCAPEAIAVTSSEEVFVAITASSGEDLAGERAEQLVLELKRFRCGLDHEIAPGEVGQGRRGGEPLDRRGGARLGHPAALGLAVKALDDRRVPVLEGLSDWVVQQRVGAAHARELRDAGTHRAGAEDADRLRSAHRQDYDGTSALIPVSARPMISFWIWEVPSYRVVTRTSRK